MERRFVPARRACYALYRMLRAENLFKSFGPVRAVRGVSFDLPAGCVVGMLGPNGAGKTTTIRMITGFWPPDSGRVVIDGIDMSDDTGRARSRIGYLPESAPLYPEMRVADFLLFRAKIFGVKRADRAAAVEKAIERCWLKDVRARRIGVLSKGYRQRVGLAAAILHEPPVMILDEPTNGLDPTQIGETRKLVRELARDRTLLFSSHVLSEVERLSDRVIVIAAGQVRADGTVRELAARSGAAAPCDLELKRPVAPENADELVAGALRAVPGVSGVERLPDPDPGWLSLRVSSRAGAADVCESIAELARAKAWVVRMLVRRAPSLEQVFLEMLESAPPARPGGGS